MNTILLAAVLVGSPAPENRLFLGCHSGTHQAKRLIADVRNDAWLNSQFVVVIEEKDWFEPRWKTSRMGQWSAWPKRDDAPRGPFVTAGMSTIWLRPTLERHLHEMRDPNDYDRFQYYWPWAGLIKQKRHDAPVPVPADQLDPGW